MRLRSDQASFAGLNFTTRRDAAERLVGRALALTADRPNVRLLDLGCGAGEVAIQATLARSDVNAVALDISPANVAAALTSAYAKGVGDRVSAVCVDYMAWSGQGPFDIIVSDSVLQHIVGNGETLAQRLADDLVLDGILIATIPLDTFGNAVRILARGIWRRLPAAIDKLALAVAQRLYPKFSKEALADRITYLRIIPERLWSAAVADTFAHHGLDVVEDAPWASPSAAKLEHRLIVMRRALAPGVPTHCR